MPHRSRLAAMPRAVNCSMATRWAAARRAAAPRTPAAAGMPAPAARDARIEQDIERHVQDEPAEPGRHDEQRGERDQERDEEPAGRVAALLLIEPQRGALLPFRGV